MSIKNPVRRGRLWLYGPDDYDGMPLLYAGQGGDEFGRRTVIVTVRRLGSIVLAYRTCYCADCAYARVQTERLEFESAVCQAHYGLSEDEFWEADLTQAQVEDAIDAFHRPPALTLIKDGDTA